ncbi:MAG: aldo/keto reductase [Aeromicrobium sp.]|uniref:aldo/keto reductase n=1 Tax=Aeromicrobium sp. TaxID=1871063 RepID=UPI00260FA2E8|nr:aldo/keto reductase [Aeromicrobium sp.]MDF1706019.1 aldo/keto reductase [Aeromicrobium sp.]
MPQRSLGDVQVSAIGLGGMPMSVDGRPEEDRSIRTIHAALDAGLTLIDTADAYHRATADVGHDESGHNELLIAKALRAWGGDASSVLVATKGGHTRTASGDWPLDGSPEHLKRAAKASAQRLGVEAIGLYQHHRPDPAVPYEETIGALRDLLDEGVIRQAGISNADLDQIRLAHTLLDGRLASVQNQFSPAFRSSRAELELCADLGVAFLPWSPLGGIGSAAELGDHYAENAAIAHERGVSPQQVALAWELALSPTVIPIPGSSRPESILDSIAAAHLTLTPDEIARLDAVA